MENAIYPHRGKVISEIILKFWHRTEFWTCFHSFPTEGKICFCINNFRIKTLEMNSYGICQCCLRQFSSKLRKDLRELGPASFLSLTAVVFLSTAPCLLPITMKKASVVVKKRGGRGTTREEVTPGWTTGTGLLPEPAPCTNLMPLPQVKTHKAKKLAEQRVWRLLDLKPSSVEVYKPHVE